LQESYSHVFILKNLIELIMTSQPTVCVTCGWAGRDKTPRAGFCLGVGKSPKMAQNPTRQVHALLARFYFGEHHCRINEHTCLEFYHKICKELNAEKTTCKKLIETF
jgi:hypothetical protein